MLLPQAPVNSYFPASHLFCFNYRALIVFSRSCSRSVMSGFGITVFRPSVRPSAYNLSVCLSVTLCIVAKRYNPTLKKIKSV